ncbi:hypothetical protein GCM10020370_01570 [Paenibacillus hodogayensis]
MSDRPACGDCRKAERGPPAVPELRAVWTSSVNSFPGMSIMCKRTGETAKNDRIFGGRQTTDWDKTAKDLGSVFHYD